MFAAPDRQVSPVVAINLVAMDMLPALLDGTKHHMFTLDLHLPNLGLALATALSRLVSNPMASMLINLQ